MNRRRDNPFGARRAVLLLLLVIPPRGSALARAADLLAHANDQTLWIAQIEQQPVLHTDLRYRALGGELQWREHPRLTGRAIDLASRGNGTTAAVLMESGEWLLVWPGGYSSGPALPESAKMVALAGRGDRLIAVAITGGTRRSSTAPATSTAASATQPATEASVTSQPSSAPAPERLALFEFDGAAWKRLADLPDDIAPSAIDLELALIDGRPTVAVTGNNQTIRVIEWSAAAGWAERGAIAPGFAPRQFQLLDVSGRPLLWFAGNSDAGQIVQATGASAWSSPIRLPLEKPIVSPRGRAFVMAGGNLRLFIENENNRIFEQCYRSDGTRVGNIAELAPPRPGEPVSLYNNWPTLIVLAAVLFVMFTSMRRGDEEHPAPVAGVTLAPYSMRLVAGAIDLLPVFITLIVLCLRAGSTDPADLPPLPVILAITVYLAHTLIGELIAGRSIGKMLTGLRVTAVDGARPRAGQVIVRNLMRLIDMFPLLLLLIFFSPLRQRVGDMLAATIVVSAAQPQQNEQEKYASTKTDQRE